MSEELKPCPFCGGPVMLEEAHVQNSMPHGRRQFWGVVCRNTTNLGGSCCMEQVPSASKEAAIGRWNMRTLEAQAARDAQTIAELRVDAEWNKGIRASVDDLLSAGGYSDESSARHQLAMMRFDAARTGEAT